MFTPRVLEPVALCGEVGKGGGEIGENFLGAAEPGIGLGYLGVDATAAAGALPRFGSDILLFGGQTRDRLFGVGGEALLAFGVGGKLNKPEIEFDDAVLGTSFFAIKILQTHVETMQCCTRARFRVAQFRKARRRRAPGAWKLRPPHQPDRRRYERRCP